MLNANNKAEKEEYIAAAITAIIVMLFLTGAVWGYFKIGGEDPSKISFECRISADDPYLKKYISNCDKETDTIALTSPMHSESANIFATIDKESLIKSCITSPCTESFDIQNDYVSINATEPEKSYVLIFSNTPNEEDLKKAFSDILQKSPPQINDQFLVSLANDPSMPLALSFEYVPLEIKIVNSDKNRHKIVEFSSGKGNSETEEKYGLFAQTSKTIPIFSNTDFYREVNTYMGTLATQNDTVAFYDFLETGVNTVNAASTDVIAQVLFIIDDNVQYPTVYSGGQYSYGIDEESCQKWHWIADSHNREVNSCNETKEEEDTVNCGSYYNRNYDNYFFLKYKGNRLDSIMPNINSDLLDLREERVWDSCSSELERIVNKLT
ncbi:MAG: hypothetical protein ABID64_00160 [Nitrospirota bacterium]